MGHRRIAIQLFLHDSDTEAPGWRMLWVRWHFPESLDWHCKLAWRVCSCCNFWMKGNWSLPRMRVLPVHANVCGFLWIISICTGMNQSGPKKAPNGHQHARWSDLIRRTTNQTVSSVSAQGKNRFITATFLPGGTPTNQKAGLFGVETVSKTGTFWCLMGAMVSFSGLFGVCGKVATTLPSPCSGRLLTARKNRKYIYCLRAAENNRKHIY